MTILMQDILSTSESCKEEWGHKLHCQKDSLAKRNGCTTIRRKVQREVVMKEMC